MKQMSFWLCFVASAICLCIHAMTFVTHVEPLWILVPFALIFTSIGVGKSTPQVLPAGINSSSLRWIGFSFLLYALCLFAFFLWTTGGASEVLMRDGLYYYGYKGKIIRQISFAEFFFFPTMFARVMSVWLFMMAILGSIPEKPR